MSDVIVSIDQVTKQYRGSQLPAISNLSLSVSSGSVLGLLGPNGAGKSTLIMMMCGLLKPDAGSISVFGLPVGGNETQVREKIGVAPQEIALFPTLTATENLFYFGKMYGLSSTHLKKVVPDFLDQFGLLHKANKRVDTFSGGMKRRLNLIAALLHQPQLVILDEPTAGVDVQSRNMIIDFLIRLKAKNTSIIYSSHFLEEAEKICTHVAILNEGALVTSGTTSAMLADHEECKSLEEIFLKLTGKSIRD